MPEVSGSPSVITELTVHGEKVGLSSVHLFVNTPAKFDAAYVV